MNRCAFPLLLIFLLASLYSFAQTGYMFVKKGIKKKATYQLGDPLMLRLKDQSLCIGFISLVKGDTIYVSGRPVAKTDIKEVLVKRAPKKRFPDGKTVALIAAGSIMTSGGLALSDKDHQTEALIAGPVIGFGPLLLKHFGSRVIRLMRRAKYKIGKKFYLQVLDLNIAR